MRRGVGCYTERLIWGIIWQHLIRTSKNADHLTKELEICPKRIIYDWPMMSFN